LNENSSLLSSIASVVVSDIDVVHEVVVGFAGSTTSSVTVVTTWVSNDLVFDAILGTTAPSSPFSPVGTDWKFAFMNVNKTATVCVWVTITDWISISRHVTF